MEKDTITYKYDKITVEVIPPKISEEENQKRIDHFADVLSRVTGMKVKIEIQK